MAIRKKKKLPPRAAPASQGRKAAPGGRDWPRILGEATLIVLVVVVPLVIHRTSRNLMDLKDFTLGVGVIAGLALVLFTSLARGSLSWASVRLNALVGAYLCWAAISIVYSQYRFATISEGARLAAHVGLFWLVILSVRDMRQVRRIVGAAILAAVPMCIYAFMQTAGRDPIPWDFPTFRAFSFLGNPTYLAGYLVLLIPLAVATAWPRREETTSSATPRPRTIEWVRSAFFLAVAVMMFVALVLTVSLSPIMGIGLGMAVAIVPLLVVCSRNVRRIAIPGIAAGLILFIVFGYLFYQRLPPSQQTRVQQVMHFQDPYGKERGLIQRAGLEIFRQQPLVGKAYGTYAILALERLAPSWYSDLGKSASTMLVTNYAHNEFIEVLAEVGVVGGGLFLALVATAFSAAFRVALRHPDPEWRRLGPAITVGMVAFLFQNLFGLTFRQTGTVTFFWLSLGLLAVAQSRLGVMGAEGPAPALREYRFRRLPLPALVAVGIGLVAVVTAVTWLGKGPVESNVLFKQAEREAKQGRFQAAAQLADEGLQLNPYSTAGYYVSAYAWGSLGSHERSLQANENALKVLPGNASVYYNMGVNYKELGRLEEARESFKRAIDLMPTAMRHHAAMTELLMQMGRYDEALTYAEEAVRLEPANPDVRLLLADLQSRRGDLAAAAVQMDTASRLAPGNLSVLSQLASIYFRQGNFQGTAQACSEWVRMDPNAFPAYVLLGSSRYNLKDYPAARAAFRKAVELEPDNLSARLRLAYCEVQLNNPPGAHQQFEWLASKHPESPEGRTAARMLRAGRQAASQVPAGWNGQSPGGR